MLFFCLSTVASHAPALTIICKNEKSVRTLRTEKTTTGCRAIYTKQGVDQVVGASVRDSNSCEGIIEGIRKTLEGSVWKCRDVKDSVISNLSE